MTLNDRDLNALIAVLHLSKFESPTPIGLQPVLYWVQDDLMKICYEKSITPHIKVKKTVNIKEIDDVKLEKKGNVHIIRLFKGKTKVLKMQTIHENDAQSWYGGLTILLELCKKNQIRETAWREGSRISKRRRSSTFSNNMVNKRATLSISSDANFNSFRAHLKKTSVGEGYFKSKHRSQTINDRPISSQHHSYNSAPIDLKTVADKDKKLFDYVLCIELPQNGEEKKPTIKSSYPLLTALSDAERHKLTTTVAPLCFPDFGTHSNNYSKNSQFDQLFSFVLKSDDQSNAYGFARRVKAKSKNSIVCYCLIANEYCYQFFSEILDNVKMLSETQNSVRVFNFLKSVSDSPYPYPGTTNRYSIFGCDDIYITRPFSDHMFECVNYHDLFSSLSIENIVMLFKSLLFEHKLLFVAKDLTKLSSSILSLLALLFPFAWENVYMVALPEALLSLLAVPFPSVIGLNKCHLETVKKEGYVNVKDNIIIDLDEGTIAVPSAFEKDKLPPQLEESLIKELTQLVTVEKKKKKISFLSIKKKSKNKINVAQLPNIPYVFLNIFFKPLLHNFRTFLTETESGHHFDTTSFIESFKGKPHFNFVNHFFAQTAMANQWIQRMELSSDEISPIFGVEDV